MLVALMIGALLGMLVYLIGTFFDRTADNRFAAIAGFVVFLLVFLVQSGIRL